jgi:hypothetical protein
MCSLLGKNHLQPLFRWLAMLAVVALAGCGTGPSEYEGVWVEHPMEQWEEVSPAAYSKYLSEYEIRGPRTITFEGDMLTVVLSGETHRYQFRLEPGDDECDHELALTPVGESEPLLWTVSIIRTGPGALRLYWPVSIRQHTDWFEGSERVVTQVTSDPIELVRSP